MIHRSRHDEMVKYHHHFSATAETNEVSQQYIITLYYAMNQETYWVAIPHGV